MLSQSIGNTWQKLTAPHPSITDIEQRRQSRLLAILTLVLGFTSVIGGIALAYRSVLSGGYSSTAIALFVSLIFLATAYFLNRSGRYKVSAYFFIGEMFFFVHFSPLFTSDLSWLFFASALMILASLLLSWREIYLVFFASLAVQIGYAALSPGHVSMSNLGIFIVFFITVPVLLAYTRYRDQLEQERQKELRAANEKLRDSERSLENRIVDRTRDLEAARQRAERTSAVAKELARAANETDIVQALQALKPDITTLFHVFVDGQGQPEYVAAVAVFTDGKPDQNAALLSRTYKPEQMPVLQAAFQKGNEPIYNFTNDPERTEFERQQAKQRGVEVVVGIALKSARQWQGLVTMGWKDATQINEEMKALLADLASPLADSVAARRAYVEVQAAQQETERLYALSRSVNASLTYADILTALGSEFGPFDFSANLTIFKSQEANTPVVDATSVAALRPKAKTAEAMNVAVPNPIIYDRDGLLEIDDIANPSGIAPEYLAFFKNFSIRALLSANLMVGQKVIGALSFSSPTPRQFTVSERRLIRSMADLAAAAIERSRLYEEQVKVADQLRKADEIKSQFLASMSHELRTPLNAILNFTEFVSMGMLGPVNDKQHEALNKSLGSGKHLLALINDVLDITKIESGMMKLFVEPDIDLHKELDAVIAATETILKDKPVQFLKEIDPELPLVLGDRRRIRQILFNLLSNAAKFTEEGTITFTVAKQDDDLLFTVKDTGPGIALEDQTIIFEPFVQTDVGIQHAGGTGLGLPISRRLAEAHGGRLWLDSEAGHGATFFVSLPIRSPQLLELSQAVQA